MDPFAPNYLLFGIYIAVGLMLGVLTNFLKFWSVLAYFLWIFIGIYISGSPIGSEGILERIRMLISPDTIELLIPISLLAGVTYLIGRYGYQFSLKKTKNLKRKHWNER